jgi:prophage regulatory protein
MTAQLEHYPCLLTWKHLKENIGIPYSREHVRRLEKAGKFPKRIPLGTQKIAWWRDEILAWLAERAAERENRIYRTRE